MARYTRSVFPSLRLARFSVSENAPVSQASGRHLLRSVLLRRGSGLVSFLAQCEQGKAGESAVGCCEREARGRRPAEVTCAACRDAGVVRAHMDRVDGGFAVRHPLWLVDLHCGSYFSLRKGPSASNPFHKHPSPSCSTGGKNGPKNGISSKVTLNHEATFANIENSKYTYISDIF